MAMIRHDVSEFDGLVARSNIMAAALSFPLCVGGIGLLGYWFGYGITIVEAAAVMGTWTAFLGAALSLSAGVSQDGRNHRIARRIAEAAASALFLLDMAAGFVLKPLGVVAALLGLLSLV